MKPVFLELFSGTKVMSKEFERLGWDTVTVDIDPKTEPDFCMDVMDITPEWVSEIGPTMIWAGIDCSCFTVMTISKYWTEDGHPKPENWGLPLLRHTVDLIDGEQPRFWVIENPRAMMRKTEEVSRYNRYEVWYCQYGDDVAKPTDLFGMLPPTFQPKICFNGNRGCHHAYAPRGSHNGIQGRKTKEERAQYPQGLCIDVARNVDDWCQGKVEGWWYDFMPGL